MIEVQERIFRKVFMIESSSQNRIINLYRSAFEKRKSEFVRNDRKKMIDFFRFQIE